MFKHLIESGSHRDDLARRSSFFLGTLGIYALLSTIAGIASIYADDTHLGQPNLELLTLVTPMSSPAETENRPVQLRPPTDATPDPTDHQALPTRTNFYANVDAPLIPRAVSSKGTTVPPLPFGGAKIGQVNSDAGGEIGPPRVGSGYANDAGGARVPLSDGDDVKPPPPQPTPTPLPKQIILPSSVLTGKAIYKPAPPYPLIAKQTHADGAVTVEILIDEQGRVISAQATSGHPLLRAAAQQAALQARFSPTLLRGQPVKVSGVITYNFVLQ